jgi:photosystem II stability/assembly factor-like uncharacterized protein
MCAVDHAQTGPVKTVIVYKQPGRFAGWPANHGIWSWDDEIVVGFEAGYFRAAVHEHAIDYTRPAEHLLARSRDGGETWAIEKPESLKPPPGIKIAGVPGEAGGRPVTENAEAIDFTRPGFAMTFRMADIHLGPSRFYYSDDRGATWRGPFRVPDFGQRGIAARTDYIVDGPRRCTAFLTAAKSNGREGRVICVRTDDGGVTWTLVSFVTPEPAGNDYAIMPSSVRLSHSAILTAVRYRQWIDTFRSDDNGRTWRYNNRVVTGNENPPSLIRLKDGRLAVSYGFRSKPFGVRVRLSEDEGRTWGGEIMLRHDGGSWDLGYARSVQRPDGKIVTVYYFNEANDQERFIAATIWDPGPASRK